MAKVVLKKLEKKYPNKFRAVHGIDLEIKDGEFIVFVGPSGCGKSTILRMIAGLEEVTSGEILIEDKLVNNLEPKDRGIAMVFQNYALYPHMTVYENMAFGLKMSKISKDEIDRRVKEAAEKLEITQLLDRKPSEISGGQKQRVAIGRAIVRKPNVFLFDEPLSNLDAKLRASMRVKIIQLHKDLKIQGKTSTMVYVTHDQTEAMTMGDRICVLNTGRVIQVDTPLNLYHNPVNKFVAGFIGSPAMNFLDGTIVEHEGKIVFIFGKTLLLLFPENKAIKLKKYINKKVILGIRPENIGTRFSHYNVEKINFVKGTIKVVEYMGNEEFIHFSIEGIDIISRVEVKKNENTKYKKVEDFYFDMDKIHIFNFETEESIKL